MMDFDITERLFKYREIKPSPDGRYPDCWYWTSNKINKGYGQICLQYKIRYVHRISAMLWLGFDIDSELKVLHHCDNPPCFNPGHLFIGTNKDNSNDMINKNRQSFGVAHGRCKLTENIVRQIRKLHGQNKLSQIDIANRFGVSQMHVSQIVRRVVWANTKD